MEDIIEQTISDSEIEKFCKAYDKAKEAGGQQEIEAKFQYAHALLRSTHAQDIKHGISLFESLYYDGDRTARRDYLYYISIGQTRLKNYDLALDCVNQFIQFEPQNQQALKLRTHIKEKMTKEGLLGMAITGGAALVVGGLIGIAMSLAKK